MDYWAGQDRYSLQSLIDKKFLAWPRTGYIYQALHIFKYLETHIDNDFSFDPLYQNVTHVYDAEFLICEMKQSYVDATEDLPTNALQPRGKSIKKNRLVDGDHGGDRITTRS